MGKAQIEGLILIGQVHTGHGKAIQAVERAGTEVHRVGEYGALRIAFPNHCLICLELSP